MAPPVPDSQLLSSDFPVRVKSVSHRYGETKALSDVSLDVVAGSLTGLLGPNGSGKTTLFRLLATLLPVQSGSISVMSHDVGTQADIVRDQLGVIFQSPALDGRLTVAENLRCHGQLYGIERRDLKERIHTGLQRLELTDRQNDRVEALSGGLKRRVELAKGLLHRPQVLLLDEPSTGLDVLARRRFWDLVDDVRRSDGTTVIVSTHLMDEAERCDHLFLLHEGRMVRSGSPSELRSSIPQDRLTVRCYDTQQAVTAVQTVFGQAPVVSGDVVTLQITEAGKYLPQLLDRLGSKILSVEIAQASLDDVFVDVTGRGLEENLAQ